VATNYGKKVNNDNNDDTNNKTRQWWQVIYKGKRDLEKKP
jgi:hypothetical protein